MKTNIREILYDYFQIDCLLISLSMMMLLIIGMIFHNLKASDNSKIIYGTASEA